MRRGLFKTMALCCALLLIAPVLTFSATPQTYNSIRIAFYSVFSAKMPIEAYCQKAKKCGFNYLATAVDFDSGGKFQQQYLVNLFTMSAAAGLRFIPVIGMSSGASYDLRTRAANPHIEENIIGPSRDRRFIIGCHEFAPKPSGVDSTFGIIVKGIKAAKEKAAGYSAPLEYVFVNHDEFAYFWEEVMMIGGGPPWLAVKGRFSPSDRRYLDSLMDKGYTLTSAFNHCIVAEMYRRLTQIQQELPSVKMMMFGDAFDPNLSGGFPLYTYKSTDPSDKLHSVKLTPQIAALPGLHTDEKKRFRENIVVLPWAYNIKTGTYAQCLRVNPKDTMRLYDAAGTFGYLASNGFSFLYHSAVPNINACSYKRSRLLEGVDMMRRYSSASRQFRANCLGYACNFYDTTDVDFALLDSMQNANAGFLPQE
jgi:hypothetical protein